MKNILFAFTLLFTMTGSQEIAQSHVQLMGGNWVDLLTRVAQPAVESADIDADI